MVLSDTVFLSPVRRVRRLATAGVLTLAVLGTSTLNTASAAGCTGSQAQPTPASRSAVNRTTVCLINAERRRRGLRSVLLNAKLSAAARLHSRDMVDRQYFSHTEPDGSTLVSRVRAAGYLDGASRWKVGEILAWGSGAYASPRAIVRAWMRSPGHREQLLTPDYRDIGIGLNARAPVVVPAAGATYTVDFGVTR